MSLPMRKLVKNFGGQNLERNPAKKKNWCSFEHRLRRSAPAYASIFHGDSARGPRQGQDEAHKDMTERT